MISCPFWFTLFKKNPLLGCGVQRSAQVLCPYWASDYHCGITGHEKLGIQAQICWTGSAACLNILWLLIIIYNVFSITSPFHFTHSTLWCIIQGSVFVLGVTVFILITRPLFLPIMVGAPSVTVRMILSRGNPWLLKKSYSFPKMMSAVALSPRGSYASSASRPSKTKAFKVCGKNAQLWNVVMCCQCTHQ